MSLVKADKQLPANIEDLSKFVLVGREKLVAVRAEIRAIDKVGLAEEVRRQKLEEAQAISEAVLDAEVKIGELMARVPKATGGQPFQKKPTVDTAVQSRQQTKTEVINRAGFTPKQVQRFETLAKNRDIVEQAKAEARENDDIVSRSLVLNMVKSKKKEKQLEQARADILKQNKPTAAPKIFIRDSLKVIQEEKYDLLLTDPPYSTDVEDINGFVDAWLYKALCGVKDTGFAYIFIGAYPESVAVARTRDIIEYLDNNGKECPERMSFDKESGRWAKFRVISWGKMKRRGYKVVVYESGRVT